MLSSLAAAAKGYVGDKEQMDQLDFLNYMTNSYPHGGGNKGAPKDTEENVKDFPSTGSLGFPDENVVRNHLYTYLLQY